MPGVQRFEEYAGAVKANAPGEDGDDEGRPDGAPTEEGRAAGLQRYALS